MNISQLTKPISVQPCSYPAGLQYTALYERALCDTSSGDNNNISNLKKILTKYAASNNLLNLRHFSDTGASCLCYDRPVFQEMKEEILNGNISTVVVSDIDCISQDETENYLFMKTLQLAGVRLIDVSSGLDTNCNDSFNRILHHLRDCTGTQGDKNESI